MFDNRWDENLDFDWEFIRSKWLLHWDTTIPVLLEKSPPNLMRAKSIENVFSPSYFIIFYRNPYAHVDSLMKRTPFTLKQSAEFSIFCLKRQWQNMKTLKNKIAISYETFSDSPQESAKQITNFLPEIGEIDFDKKFTSHNFLGEKRMKITNLNEKKISNFSDDEFKVINRIYCKEEELINEIGYPLISPSSR